MPNAPLSMGAYGDNVTRLQKLLRQLGFQLHASEVNRLFFGPSTRQAVQQFQQRNGLPTSGMVDEQTAMLLQRNQDPGQLADEQLDGAPTSAASSPQLPPESPTQQVQGSPAVAPQPETPPANGVLSIATRYIEKATLVPLQVEQASDGNRGGLAIVKNAFVRQLSLRPGEVMAVRQQLGMSHEDAAHSVQGALSEAPWDLLAAFEQPSMPSLLPPPTRSWMCQ